MLRRAAPALGLFVAVRALGLAVVALWAHASGTDAGARLVRWDAQWYARIAAHGYGFTAVTPNGRHLSAYAFFPLFPFLERVVGTATGLAYAHAGLLVSAVCSVVAAFGIFAVGDRLHGRRTALVLVLLWAALPVGVVESMAYSEAVFTALAAWALYAVLAERWVAAGVLATLAGLTRPLGVAVAAAVVVPALVAWRRERTRREPVLAGAALAPLGSLGYVGWVGLREHDPLGYFRVGAGWGNSFDGGAAFAEWVSDHFAGAGVLGVLLVLAVVVLVGLLVVLVRDREPLTLVVYAASVVAMTLTTSGYFGSKPRYLLPAFPLLLPAAVRLARWRPALTLAALAALVLGSAAYGAVWLLGPGPP